MASTFVLPGDFVEQSSLPVPKTPSKGLKVGPGLQQLRTSEIRSVVTGTLGADNKKNAAWVEIPDGRYTPTLNDPVIATVQRSSGEAFLCSLTPHAPPAHLPHLAFEAVTKKNRPQFSQGVLVYARVTLASRYVETELSCVDPNTGRSEGLGELKGGMVFDVSLGFARRLLYSKQRERGGIGVLEDLAEKIRFEIATGRNGKVWVNAEDGNNKRATLVVGKALQETDKGSLNLDEQKKLVKQLLRSLAGQPESQKMDFVKS